MGIRGDVKIPPYPLYEIMMFFKLPLIACSGFLLNVVLYFILNSNKLEELRNVLTLEEGKK